MKKELVRKCEEMTDEDLLNLIFTEKDRLTRSVVDEIICRKERLLEALIEIITSESNWYLDIEENGWWPPIHATYILGSIGGKEVVEPLLISLRMADKYDCDWILDYAESILANSGLLVKEPLIAFLLDKTNSFSLRMAAVSALAAITIKNPECQREIFDLIASILNDKGEDMSLRGLVGSILIDFRKKQYKKSLLAFIEEEKELIKQDEHYCRSFDKDHVLNELFKDDLDLRFYTQDWLKFYSPEEIEKRQSRWKVENSWWRSKLEYRKSKKRIKEIEEKIKKDKAKV